METSNLINKGMILRQGGSDRAQGPRTYIISGIGRGGTTLVASILKRAGIFMGEHVVDLVHEDQDMLATLHSYDPRRLDALITSRNGLGVDWGFKVPHIAAFISPDEVDRFRNPHLILIFRDPVAIAVRHALAEYQEPLAALEDTTIGMNGLAHFMNQTSCPALLLSYEKALLFPEDFVDALAGFCGLAVDFPLRNQMLELVRPNAEGYITGARRRFAGVIDRYREGTLFGWCCELGVSRALELDLFVDGRKTRSFVAGDFRADLVPAGFGDGHHGFAVPIEAPAAAEIRVRIAGRTFELENSGRSLAKY